MKSEFKNAVEDINHLNHSTAEDLADAFIEDIGEAPEDWSLNKHVKVHDRREGRTTSLIALFYPNKGPKVGVEITPNIYLQAIVQRSGRTSKTTKNPDKIVNFIENKLSYTLRGDSE